MKHNPFQRLFIALSLIFGLSFASLPATAAPGTKCFYAHNAAALSLLKKISGFVKTVCKNEAKGLAMLDKISTKGTAKANKKVPALFAAGKCDPDFVAKELDKNLDGELDDYPLEAATFVIDVTECDGLDDPDIPM